MGNKIRCEVRTSGSLSPILKRVAPDSRSAAIRAYMLIGMATMGVDLSAVKAELSELAQTVSPGKIQDEILSLMWTGNLTGTVAGGDRGVSGVGVGTVAGDEREECGRSNEPDGLLDDNEGEFIS